MNLEESELVQAVTAIVRKADAEFQRDGGSSRHWVRDYFLPLLKAGGWELSRSVRQSR